MKKVAFVLVLVAALALSGCNALFDMMRGPAGQQGEMGMQGIQGPQGNPGMQGPAGADGTSPGIAFAYTDATTWNIFLNNAIAYGNGVFVTESYDGEAGVSADGSSWSLSAAGTLPGSFGPCRMVFGGGVFLYVYPNGEIHRSVDGLVWTTPLVSANSVTYSVAAGDGAGHWVAIGTTIAPATWVATSSDNGQSWTEALESTGTLTTGISALVFGGGKFVAVDSAGSVFSSADSGATWSLAATVTSADFADIKYGDVGGAGLFSAVGTDTALGLGMICTSPDGLVWTRRFVSETLDFSRVTYGDGLFVAGTNYYNTTTMANESVLYLSYDGFRSWNRVSIPTGQYNLTDFAYGSVGNGLLMITLMQPM